MCDEGSYADGLERGYRKGMDDALQIVRDRTDDEWTHEIIRQLCQEEGISNE